MDAKTDTGPRDFVLEVTKKLRGKPASVQFEEFRSMLSSSASAQRAVDWFFFKNMIDGLPAPRANLLSRTRDPVAAAETSRSTDQIVESIKRQIMMLDLIMPNEKPMKHCTGAEMARFGNRYQKIADKVGKTKIVGDVLSEDDVKEILK